MNADFIIEMDGDVSHDPKYISSFLKAIRDCDVVIGSRYMKSGKDKERTPLRRTLSSLARLYIIKIFKFKYKRSNFRLQNV